MILLEKLNLNTIPAISASVFASISRITVPAINELRSSNKLYRDNVATWGLLHLSPPSSTFSSYLYPRLLIKYHCKFYIKRSHNGNFKLYGIFQTVRHRWTQGIYETYIRRSENVHDQME